MTTFLRWPLHFLILLHISINQLTLAQDENQFIYNDFSHTNLSLGGIAEIHSNGLLQLTNTSKQQTGYAFHQIPVKFNSPSSSRFAHPYSFSTNFVFAMVPQLANGFGGHGLVFVISPSIDFSHAVGSEFLGLFNSSNNGLSSNHVFAVEFDTVKSFDFDDINDNHVGIDLNNLKSNFSTPATYFSNVEEENKSLFLNSGDPIQVWIDYDGFANLINVTLAPTNLPKPKQPLLSVNIDLSLVLLDSMYVGFTSATGVVASSHYLLGWSFSRSGEAEQLDFSKLPSISHRKSGKGPNLAITISVVAVSIMIIVLCGSAYMLRKKIHGEFHEKWEEEYGPQRLSYSDLCKATKGFRDTQLIGVGGFGKVYAGVLPSSNEQVAVKKISQDSTQGMKEFVSEIASMGRVRHRNLVPLLGYCRRRGELLLVYDFMPNGSLDEFLHNNQKNLNWAQRCQIIKGIASGLLYLHEECEQVVLHRDVKSSNVLLDADLNGRLSDFGLARLYDRGENLQTTQVVGTVGYIAPELIRTGKASTSTDVFAFGAFILEVACGRRPIEVQGLPKAIVLVDWVFESWKRGDVLQTSDPRLEGAYVVEEMELVLKLGILCSHSDPAARPGMRQVMQYLDGSSILPEIPVDGAGASTAMHDGASPEFVIPFPSSSVNVSVCSASSLDTILMGR